MKVTPNNIKLIHSALTNFIGIPVTEFSEESEGMNFLLADGVNGRLVQHMHDADWDIVVEDETVYVIEEELMEILSRGEIENTVGLYKQLRFDFDWDALKYKSRRFLSIVYDVLEKNILDENIIQLTVDEVRIAEYQIFCVGNMMKFKVCLN